MTRLKAAIESPIQIDPVGKATRILPIFLEKPSMHLATLACPALEPKQVRFTLPLIEICEYILKLETKSLYMVVCSGFAVIWMEQVNGFLVTNMQQFVAIRAFVKLERWAKRAAEALQKRY